MDENVRINWSNLEDSIWNVLPCLGNNWACKYFTSEFGYAVLVTDSTGLWGEICSSSAVKDNGEKWAPCLEAGVKEMSELILTDLIQDKHKILKNITKEKITVELKAKLNNLPYEWIFNLDALPQNMMEKHLIEPVLVQLEVLSTKVSQLKEELKKKQMIIDDLQPQSKITKSPKKKEDKTISVAADKMLNTGIGLMISQHLYDTPEIMKAITNSRITREKGNSISNNFLKKNPPKSRANKRLQKGAVSDDEDSDPNFDVEEIKVQDLPMVKENVPKVTKKKKKLNI